jgi:uncharacterized protein (DUF2267 family)
MKSAEKQEHQKIPRLGSEVRFADGARAGRIRELNSQDFVVIRGKKRVKRLHLPYSSVAAIGNRVVTLRNKKSEIAGRDSQVNATEIEGTSKKNFIRDIDEHLALDNTERSERIARIVLYLLSKRLSGEKKKKLKKSLPPGIRGLWAIVEQPGTGQYFNMVDFLLPVKKQGRLQSMEEAYIVTREVFASIRRIMPIVEAKEISSSLPRGLQEIWESASSDGQDTQRGMLQREGF